MESQHHVLPLALVAAGSLLVHGCDDGSSSAPKSYTIAFEANFGASAFVCGQTYAGIGTGATSAEREFQATDFRFYVSNPTLQLANGTEVPLELDTNDFQAENVALLDFENGCGGGTVAESHEVVGVAPSDEYVGVCFDLGVPFELNHLSADAIDTPAPLTASGMMWNWQTGRKFVRIDGKGNPTAANGGQSFFVHLGSTGCTSGAPTEAPAAPCTHPNVVRVCLDYDFDAPHFVVADAAALLAGSDVSKNANGAPGCMSGTGDDECAQILPRFDLPFTYTGSTSPAPAVATQAQGFFHVRHAE